MKSEKWIGLVLPELLKPREAPILPPFPFIEERELLYVPNQTSIQDSQHDEKTSSYMDRLRVLRWS